MFNEEHRREILELLRGDERVLVRNLAGVSRRRDIRWEEIQNSG
jgi:hypothetical protein